MFIYFPLILLFCSLKMDFYGFPGPWDNFNPVRIANSLNLPQKLHKIVEYCAGNEPRLLEKLISSLFQKLILFNGFRGKRPGQNDRNDRGIISCFHQNSDFDM